LLILRTKAVDGGGGSDFQRNWCLNLGATRTGRDDARGGTVIEEEINGEMAQCRTKVEGFANGILMKRMKWGTQVNVIILIYP